MTDLNIAEIPYASGVIRFRYSRYPSEDGTRWIRHGLFQSFYESGKLASEGQYVDGAEHGLWRDYHENGHLAAEGSYKGGEEIGKWCYWNENGAPAEV